MSLPTLLMVYAWLFCESTFFKKEPVGEMKRRKVNDDVSIRLAYILFSPIILPLRARMVGDVVLAIFMCIIDFENVWFFSVA